MVPKPKQSFYGSLDDPSIINKDEILPLNTNTFNSEDSNETNATPIKKSSSWGKRALTSFILVLMAGMMVVYVLNKMYYNRIPIHEKKISYNNSNPLESPIEMGLLSVRRDMGSSPSPIWGKYRNNNVSLPTNSWYLNVVSNKASVQPDDATSLYTIPYSIDTAVPSTVLSGGIRIHYPIVQASAKNVQMVDDFKNSLSLGATYITSNYTVHPDLPLSDLGLSLQWKGQGEEEDSSMYTSLVRGMPFATMHYVGGVLPSLYSYNGPASEIYVDETNKLECGTAKAGHDVTTKSELKLHFSNSDFTWIVFFSQPVKVNCQVSSDDVDTRDFKLDVTSYEDSSQPLTVRVALLDECTTGKSNIKQHCYDKNEEQSFDESTYEQLLRESASIYPTSPRIEFNYSSSDTSIAYMKIDWASKSHNSSNSDSETNNQQLLMYALPHHQEMLSGDENVEITKQCINTFHGNTCLVKGSSWLLTEQLGPAMSFTAPRPPDADIIPDLAKALKNDIKYHVSSNLLRGAADTYFSGKALARFARVIVIADELRQLASGKSTYEYNEKEGLDKAQAAAASNELPSDEDIAEAVKKLKAGVQIWFHGAEAPYVYDQSWGGLVNCGCSYVGKDQHGYCNNTFPDCPAIADVNEDFGNGLYNDHHYHYGYHVYAAAVAARFDPKWGEEHFDDIMLYIRDFANPFENDQYFPKFRQKDWFLGSSWASGIVSAENSPHGRNEESSSEAIAAYEAVALFGSVMEDIFQKSGDERIETAKLVRQSGQLLTSTELHATNRYWHVWSGGNHTNIYPEAYTQPVVGMLYETMATFQTWFAPEAVVSYGIQLMPYTPVAELRDDPSWAKILYPMYKTSCEEAGDFCVDNGWSILQAGLLATASSGKKDEALKQAYSVPAKVFDSQGGIGNSLTNTIWYIATRKATEDFEL